MNLKVVSISTFLFLIQLIELIKGESFVRPISEQWPYMQWTTKLPPGQTPSTYPPPTTARPPPEITFLPPLKDEEKQLIITDPNTGQMIYIPAHVFWNRFGGGKVTNTNRTGGGGENTPRNPFVCDFYVKSCWLPSSRPTVKPTATTIVAPSRGGGGGSHIYGHPNFHQGAFPIDPNETPRPSGRYPNTKNPSDRIVVDQTEVPDFTDNNELPRVTITTRQTRPPPPTTQPFVKTQQSAIASRGGGGGAHIYGHPNFHQGAFPDPKEPPRSSGRTNTKTANMVNEPVEDFQTSASNNYWNSAFVMPQFGITGQTRQFFGNGREIEQNTNQNQNEGRFGQRYDSNFLQQEQGTVDYKPFPVQPPESSPIFENYNPDNNVFYYISTKDIVQGSPRQRYVGGTGIGGIPCEESNGCFRKSNRGTEPRPQFTAPPLLRRTFSPTNSPPPSSNTLETKIRVTRPVPSEPKKTTTPIYTNPTEEVITTTGTSLDYVVENERVE